MALYDDALPAVYGYFVRRCGDRGAAEDLTSETFLAAMDAARKESPPSITVPTACAALSSALALSGSYVRLRLSSRYQGLPRG